MQEYTFHPIANIFPLLEGAALQELADDIAEHGLHVPIVLTMDKAIVDGRNRYRAMQAAGIAMDEAQHCTMTTLDGPSLVAYVVGLNLKRRHLSESQRAMVADKLATMRQGQRTDLAPIGARSELQVSQEEAADLLNVSRRAVQRAAKVREEGIPALAEAVEQGIVAVSTAADIATLPQPEQEEIVARGEKEILATAQRIRAERAHRTKYTGENEWYTPAEYIALAREVLGEIDLDAASSDLAQETIGALCYFSLEDDALTQDWPGRVWLNPPYSQPLIAQFIDKLLEEIGFGHTTGAILLTHNSTDTTWFHKAAHAAHAICFTKGRIRFVSALHDVAAPTQGQAFFYFGTDVQRFAASFKDVGFVVEVQP